MKTLLSSVNYLNSQDSTGLTDVLKNAVKQLSDDKDMWQKCNEMANMFLTHRQVKKVLYKLNKSPTSIWEALIKLMQVSNKIWPFPLKINVNAHLNLENCQNAQMSLHQFERAFPYSQGGHWPE